MIPLQTKQLDWVGFIKPFLTNLTGTYLPGFFAYKILLGEADSCWPEISPNSHLRGIIPEVSQPKLNYLCTTTSPPLAWHLRDATGSWPGRIPRERPLRKSWGHTGLVSAEQLNVWLPLSPGPDIGSLPRAEPQQLYQCRSVTCCHWEGQGGPVLPRGAPLRAPQGRGWGLLSLRCRSLGWAEKLCTRTRPSRSTRSLL